LSEEYGRGGKVAIKIQRLWIESKLLGDIANLKAISIPQNKQPREGGPDNSPKDFEAPES
jgi:hypothetical protein